MCKNICLGPIGDHFEYQFVLKGDTPDVHTEVTHPDMREEGHAEAWDPFVLVVCVYFFFCYNICDLKLIFIIE